MDGLSYYSGLTGFIVGPAGFFSVLVTLLLILLLFVALQWVLGFIKGLFAFFLGHRAYFYRYSGGSFYSEMFLKILFFIRLGRNKKWAVHHTLVGYVKRPFGGNDKGTTTEIFTHAYGQHEPVAVGRFRHDTTRNIKKVDIIMRQFFADGSNKYNEENPVGYVDADGNIYKYFSNYNAYCSNTPLDEAIKIGVCSSLLFKKKQAYPTRGESADLEAVPYIAGEDNANKDGMLKDSWFSMRLNKPASNTTRAIELDATGRKPRRKWYELFIWKWIQAIPLTWPVKHKAYGYGFCKQNFDWFRSGFQDVPLIYTACAAMLLLEEQGFMRYEDEIVDEPSQGMGETAIASLLAYLTLYRVLLIVPFFSEMFPFLGPDFSLMLSMVLSFFALWWVFHTVYYSVTDRPPLARKLLNMLNANVGAPKYPRRIIFFSIVGLIITYIYLPMVLVPFFVTIIIAFIANIKIAPHRKWEIADPFSDVSFNEDEDEDTNQMITKEYLWQYNSAFNTLKHLKLSLKFEPDDIQALRDNNPFRHKTTASYTHIVKKMLLDGLGSEAGLTSRQPFRPSLQVVLNKLTKLGKGHALTEIDRLNFVLSFVQQTITYVIDEQSPALNSTGINSEYCRYPQETLFDQEGDCDCKSALAASLFARAGYTVAYFTTHNHAFIGISEKHLGQLGNFMPEAFLTINNKRFLVCETTASGWTIGKSDNEHAEGFIQEAEIIEPNPIFVS